MEYESQILNREQEVDLGKSTYWIYKDQDSGNLNSSMEKYTRELDFQNESLTTDPVIGDAQFDPVVTPEQRQINGLGQKIQQYILV